MGGDRLVAEFFVDVQAEEIAGHLGRSPEGPAAFLMVVPQLMEESPVALPEMIDVDEVPDLVKVHHDRVPGMHVPRRYLHVAHDPFRSRFR